MSTAALAEPVETTVRPPGALIFETLAKQGFQTMTPSGVEFVICPSALTAQM